MHNDFNALALLLASTNIANTKLITLFHTQRQLKDLEARYWFYKVILLSTPITLRVSLYLLLGTHLW